MGGDSTSSAAAESSSKRQWSTTGLKFYALLVGVVVLYAADYFDTDMDFFMPGRLNGTRTKKSDITDELPIQGIMGTTGVPNPRDFEYCGNNNYVADRGFEIDAQVPSDGASRPFSLLPQSFERHNDDYCTTTNDLLDAIKYGQRLWEDPSVRNSTSWKLQETTPSYFLPRDCDIPILSTDQICQVFSRFSKIFVFGDSLMRHSAIGLLAGLQNDFVRGWTATADNAQMRDYCYCDGQYSEHAACRGKNNLFIDGTGVINVDVHERGYCPTSQRLTEAAGYEDTTNNNNVATTGTEQFGTFQYRSFAVKIGLELNIDFLCGGGFDCSDGRDIVLVLEGGLHFETEALPTFKHFENILRHPSLVECAKKGRILIIWCSQNTHSPSKALKYPHQSPENGEIFNWEMENLFIGEGHVNVTTIDWMAFTKRAQTSDGIHYLTETNYFKVQHLLNLAYLMQNEQRYYGTPF